MAALFCYALGGLSLLSLAALELSSPLLPSPLRLRLRFSSAAALSALSLLPPLPSLLSPSPFSPPLPLSSLAVAALFLLYSAAGALALFPAPLLDLFLSFAFAQQFLLFYLRPKDVDGVENRYFDLLLVPILVCAVSTALAAARPAAKPPRLARAAGLALQGTWFVQMGFSFFSSFMATGCSLHRRSGVDYTVKCRTHEDYHRGRAIATLQFNYHLALIVVAGVAVYGAVATRAAAGGDRAYRPLGKEMRQMRDPSFVLLSEDEGNEEEEIAAGTAAAVNGGMHSSH